MKRYYIFYFLFFLSSAFWSCNGNQDGGEKNDSDLPQASRVANEILVVMDSAQWNGRLGAELKEVFARPIPGLPQEEPTFNLSYVSPRDFQGFLKLYPNIMFVTMLNDNSKDNRVLRTYFTENSLEQMRQNPDMFMYPLKNEFARGQEVLHLFAQTEEELIKKLEENEKRLVAYFLEFERERLSERLFTGYPNKNLSEYLQKKYGFRMEFPVGYEVAIEKDKFVWTRFLDPESDRSVWVAYKDYDNENVFTKENILELRRQFARPYIWGDDSSTYMKTEMEAPIYTREINFNGRYAVETRGLWRLNNMTMGGPFLSYTFVDESTNRLYYIEGFAYAPGEKKREPIRELEAILWTFQSGEQPVKQAPTAANASGTTVTD